MNIQQFQYILAVEEARHFETAASKCCVTQSTLSTMVSKFEGEIGMAIFDRKKRPVEVTAEGEVIIEQLRVIAREIGQLEEMVKEIKGEVSGQLSIAAIPTIAPYLLPLFLQSFATKFPRLEISVTEQTTAEIVRRIQARELDIGIVSTPLPEQDLRSLKLYDEPFAFFDASIENEQEVAVRDLDIGNLCLLEEGHCMRTQVIKLCELHKKRLQSKLNFEYKAGSIDSLLRFVKVNRATTLLPHFAVEELSGEDLRHVRRFADPVPFRSVGLVVHRHFVKNKILEALRKEIMEKVTPLLPRIELSGKGLPPV